jgi:hypothetical protein
MGELFASGRIVDLILGLMLLEALVLLAYRRRTGRGIAPGNLVVSLLAGALLLLALRLALTGEVWPAIAACLALALVAHLWDLARRWRD